MGGIFVLFNERINIKVQSEVCYLFLLSFKRYFDKKWIIQDLAAILLT